MARGPHEKLGVDICCGFPGSLSFKNVRSKDYNRTDVDIFRVCIGIDLWNDFATKTQFAGLSCYSDSLFIDIV